MTAERRNAAVVVTLILSMTIGARILLWLEPRPPRSEAADLRHTAERATPVQEIEIACATSQDEANALNKEPYSFCAIDAEGNVPPWEARGPRVRLVVVGAATDKLSDRQQQQVLATLESLNRASGRELVPVRLAPESDPQRRPDAPVAATDLRELLVRKGIIE